MREDIKITKVYRFEELSEEVQEETLARYFDLNVSFEWWENVCEDAKTIGVGIESFDLDRGSDCRGKFLQDELDVAENVLKDHGKDCETYTDAYEFVWDMAVAENEYRTDMQGADDENQVEFDAYYQRPELLSDFQDTIFEDYRIILQKEYDYLTSEEAIRETIDANEYEFTEDGRIY